jgi:hypothetical protein
MKITDLTPAALNAFLETDPQERTLAERPVSETWADVEHLANLYFETPRLRTAVLAAVNRIVKIDTKNPSDALKAIEAEVFQTFFKGLHVGLEIQDTGPRTRGTGKLLN